MGGAIRTNSSLIDRAREGNVSRPVRPRLRRSQPSTALWPSFGALTMLLGRFSRVSGQRQRRELGQWRRGHASRLGGDPAALLEDELPPHRVAVAGHGDRRRRHQSDQPVQRAGPLGRAPSPGRPRADRPTRSGRRRRSRRRRGPRPPGHRRCARGRGERSPPADPRGRRRSPPRSPGRARTRASVDIPSRAASAAASGDASRPRTLSCPMVGRSSKAARPNAWS